MFLTITIQVNDLVFREEERVLLDAAYQTFVGRTHLFDVFSEKKWKDTGIENWAQTEYIVSLIDRGYEVTTYGKRKRDCDVIVKNKKTNLDVGIEIKTITHTNYYMEILVRQGIQKHSRADLFLFLAKVNDVVLQELDDYFRRNSYIEEHKMLNDDWMTMLAKKT